MSVLNMLESFGVIPVVKIENVELALDLGRTLFQGGLPCVEITFRTECAKEAIHLIAVNHPEILVGAGTVISIDQAKQAVAAGAKFIISPGLDLAIVDWCLKQNITVVPGIATPSEAMAAMNRGITVLKYFPAASLGGIDYLKSIYPALPGTRYIPTGGINATNMSEWLEMPFIHSVAGSWLVPPILLKRGEFVEIKKLTIQAVNIVNAVRRNKEG